MCLPSWRTIWAAQRRNEPPSASAAPRARRLAGQQRLPAGRGRCVQPVRRPRHLPRRRVRHRGCACVSVCICVFEGQICSGAAPAHTVTHTRRHPYAPTPRTQRAPRCQAAWCRRGARCCAAQREAWVTRRGGEAAGPCTSAPARACGAYFHSYRLVCASIAQPPLLASFGAPHTAAAGFVVRFFVRPCGPALTGGPRAAACTLPPHLSHLAHPALDPPCPPPLDPPRHPLTIGLTYKPSPAARRAPGAPV